MAQKTRLHPNALPGKLYGSFAGKTPSAGTKVVSLGGIYKTSKIVLAG